MRKLIFISALILCGVLYAQESFTIDDTLRMDNVGERCKDIDGWFIGFLFNKLA